VSGDTGVDDVGGDAGPVTAVGVGAVEREVDLVDPIEPPGRAGLRGGREYRVGPPIEGDDTVGLDVHDTRMGFEFRHLGIGEVEYPAVEDLFEGRHDLIRDGRGDRDPLGIARRLAQPDDVAAGHHIAGHGGHAPVGRSVEESDTSVHVDGGHPWVRSEIGGLVTGEGDESRPDRVVTGSDESAGVHDGGQGEGEVIGVGVVDDEHIPVDARVDRGGERGERGWWHLDRGLGPVVRVSVDVEDVAVGVEQTEVEVLLRVSSRGQDDRRRDEAGDQARRNATSTWAGRMLAVHGAVQAPPPCCRLV